MLKNKNNKKIISDEFNTIDKYFKTFNPPLLNGEVGIGDDGAVLNDIADMQTVVVMDTMLPNIHYPLQTSPYDIGWKLLAVNLSDLAAMGAVPIGYLLAISLPEINSKWLKEFTRGLSDLAQQYKIPLVGGDTTKDSKISLTLSALGKVPTHKAILRSKAKQDDLIIVSGYLGQGGLGLKAIIEYKSLNKLLKINDFNAEINHLNRPTPRIDLGIKLRNIASSAIDISDGLLSDLKHICKASNCGAKIHLDQIPLSSTVKHYVKTIGNFNLPLTSGDDYEICFTMPKDKLPTLTKISDEIKLPLTIIGKIKPKNCGIILKHKSESIAVKDYVNQIGYSHF